MPVETEIQTTFIPPLKAPRGNEISCKGWAQEASHAHAHEQPRGYCTMTIQARRAPFPGLP